MDNLQTRLRNHKPRSPLKQVFVPSLDLARATVSSRKRPFSSDRGALSRSDLKCSFSRLFPVNTQNQEKEQLFGQAIQLKIDNRQLKQEVRQLTTRLAAERERAKEGLTRMVRRPDSQSALKVLLRQAKDEIESLRLENIAIKRLVKFTKIQQLQITRENCLSQIQRLSRIIEELTIKSREGHRGKESTRRPESRSPDLKYNSKIAKLQQELAHLQAKSAKKDSCIKQSKIKVEQLKQQLAQKDNVIRLLQDNLVQLMGEKQQARGQRRQMFLALGEQKRIGRLMHFRLQALGIKRDQAIEYLSQSTSISQMSEKLQQSPFNLSAEQSAQFIKSLTNQGQHLRTGQLRHYLECLFPMGPRVPQGAPKAILLKLQTKWQSLLKECEQSQANPGVVSQAEFRKILGLTGVTQGQIDYLVAQASVVSQCLSLIRYGAVFQRLAQLKQGSPR